MKPFQPLYSSDDSEDSSKEEKAPAKRLVVQVIKIVPWKIAALQIKKPQKISCDDFDESFDDNALPAVKKFTVAKLASKAVPAKPMPAKTAVVSGKNPPQKSRTDLDDNSSEDEAPVTKKATFAPEIVPAKTTLKQSSETPTAVREEREGGSAGNGDGSMSLLFKSSSSASIFNGVSYSDLGVCGLMNLGNTCFINSALQCLSNTPPLTEFFLSNAYQENINDHETDETACDVDRNCEIVHCYAQLIKAIWSNSDVNSSLKKFKEAISIESQFDGSEMHDCQELIDFLLSGLHDGLNRAKKEPCIMAKKGTEQLQNKDIAKESWGNFKSLNDSIIVDTFYSQLKSSVVCPECKLVSATFDPTCILTLPLLHKRKRLINFVFVPAISKRQTVPEMGCCERENKKSPGINYFAKVRSLEVENVIVPTSGIIADVLVAIAKVLNDFVAFDGQPLFKRIIEPARLHIYSIDRFFTPLEAISDHLMEDVVVFEEDDLQNASVSSFANADLSMNSFETTSNIITTTSATSIFTKSIFHRQAKGYVLPVFIKSVRDSSVATSISRPFLIKVKQLTHEHIQKAIFLELLSCLLSGKDEEAFLRVMKGDDSFNDMSNGSLISNENNGERPYTISVVNQNASSDNLVLRPGDKLDSFESFNTFLAVNIDTKIVKQFFNFNLNTHRQVQLSSLFASGEPPICTQITLTECIKQFTASEKLSFDNSWNCSHCKKSQMAEKKLDIWSLPKILVIHLKRFENSKMHRKKLDVLVHFPVRNLDMTPFVLNNPERKAYKYDLIAVSNHTGNLEGGHYTAFAKNRINKRWYCFDDSKVSEQLETNLVSKSAYVLFYQLQDDKLDDKIINDVGVTNLNVCSKVGADNFRSNDEMNTNNIPSETSFDNGNDEATIIVSDEDFLPAQPPVMEKNVINESDVCQMASQCPNSLERHKHLHTGARLYKCKICKKTFTKKFNFLRHKHAHSDVRHFRCYKVECKGQFKRKDSLKKHLKQQHGMTLT